MWRWWTCGFTHSELLRGQLPRPSCPRGNCPRPLLNRKLVGPQNWFGDFGELKKSLSPAGILGFSAHSVVIVRIFFFST